MRSRIWSPDGAAELVVDRAHAVDVEADDGVAVPRARASTVLALQLLAEAPQVEQPRERVVGRQLDDPRLELLALAFGGALARHVA